MKAFFIKTENNEDWALIEKIKDNDSFNKENFIPAIKLTTFLILSGLCKSKGESIRLIKQKGVKIDDEIAEEESYITNGAIIQKGKRHFRKLVL